MKLWVNIAFHYKENRLQYLNKVIDSILQIQTEETKIIVNSNEMFESNAEVHQVFGLLNNWDLVWAHKKYIPEFIESDFTHFVYTEDDHVLTQQHMDYWVRNREVFKETGFLPGLHRVEYKDGKIYSVDCKTKQKYRPVTINGEEFASLEHPYQGIMILDKELAIEHVNSNSYTYKTSSHRFGYAETANSEYIYDNPPKGYSHRILIPRNTFSECWIHHCANNYVDAKHTQHGKLPIEEVF